MAKFDPYHKWLGIHPKDQPPHHYRLLGIDIFEEDLDVIESAADRCMVYVQQCALGKHLEASQQILNELSAARVCLLVKEQKKKYDAELRATLKPVSPTPSSTEIPIEEQQKTDPPESRQGLSQAHAKQTTNDELPKTTSGASAPDFIPDPFPAKRFPKTVWILAGGVCFLALTILISLQFLGGESDSEETGVVKNQTSPNSASRVSLATDNSQNSIQDNGSALVTYFTVQSEATYKQPGTRLSNVTVELFHQSEQGKAQQESLGMTTTDANGQARLLVKLTSAHQTGTFLAKLTRGNQSWERKLTQYPVRLLQELTIPYSSDSQYLSPDWIEQRLNQVGVDQLILECESEADPDVKTVGATLKLSQQILSKYPQALREQLQARLVNRREPAFAAFQSLPDNRFQIRSEWPSFKHSGGTITQSVPGHSEFVQCLVLTPLGKKVISGSQDKTIKVWDLATGKLIQTLTGHSGTVSCVAVTPDGKQVITGSADKMLKVWDLSNGKLIRDMEGHTSVVNCVAVTSDGKQIVSGSYDKTVKVWDLDSGKLIRTLEGHYSSVSCVAVTPDGKQIISGSTDKTLLVWDLTSGTVIHPLEGGSGRVSCVTVTPDGKEIISGSDENSIDVWDIESGSKLRTYKGHSSVVNCIAITADGKQVISGSDDKTLQIWELASTKQIKTYLLDDVVLNIATSTDNKTLVAGGGSERIHKLTLLSPESTIAPGSKPSPSDSSHKVDFIVRAEAASNQSGPLLKDVKIQLFHRPEQNGAPLALIGSTKTDSNGHGVLQAKLSPAQQRGTYLTKLTNGNEIWERDLTDFPQIKLHNISIPTMREDSYLNPEWIEQRLKQVGIDQLIQECAKSTNPNIQTVKTALELSRHILQKNPQAVREQLQARLVNRRETDLAKFHILPKNKIHFYSDWTSFPQPISALTRTHPGHSGVKCVAISRDGKQAVSISYKSLTVWDIASGSPIRTFKGHAGFDLCMDLTADGKHIISKSKKNSLKVWDLAKGRLKQNIRGHSSSIKFVEVTPDSRQAITSSYNASLKLWDLTSGRLIRSFGGQRNDAVCLAVTPDGEQVISGAADKSIKVWDLTSGELIQTIDGSGHNIECITVTPDGEQVITGSDDKTLKLWDLSSGSLIATYELDDHAQDMAFSQSGETLIVCSKTGKLYKLRMSMPGKSLQKMKLKNLTGSLNQIAWNEPPIPQSWPDLSLQNQAVIRSAHGKVHERFIWCVDLPLQTFLNMETDLRTARYSPHRVRPYLKNNSVLVSVICTRDEQPWKLVSGISASEVRSQNNDMSALGWTPIAIAGFYEQIEKYIVIWKKGITTTAYLDVGLSSSQHSINFQKLSKLNSYLHQQHIYFGAANTQRFSNLWYTKPPNSGKWGSWYGGIDIHRSKQGIYSFQTDTTIAVKGSSMTYSGCWIEHPSYNSVELSGLTLFDHETRATQLMNIGLRPFAIDTVFVNNGIRSSSVWYRPK